MQKQVLVEQTKEYIRWVAYNSGPRPTGWEEEWTRIHLNSRGVLASAWIPVGDLTLRVRNVPTLGRSSVESPPN